MASLSQLRSSFIKADPEPREAAEAVVLPDDSDDEVGGFALDDDDFWEAIDLMETSWLILKGLMRSDTLPSSRRRLIENHADDLKQFIDLFMVQSPSQEDPEEEPVDYTLPMWAKRD